MTRDPITIPVTPIWRRYETLRGMPKRKRLDEANRLIEHPQELANEFADSVRTFSSYTNLADAFYPLRGDDRTFEQEGEIKKTYDLVLRLKKQKGLVPTDAKGRRTGHDAGAAVSAIPASRLACTYVDRELLVQRTTSPAKWDSDRPSWKAGHGTSDARANRGGLRLDVLLADSVDRTPIVGEVKFPRDKDPFFALVQALACAAHLATTHQYNRMQQCLGRGNFPERTTAPRFDIWVLCFNHPRQMPSGKLIADLHSATEMLAARLLAQDVTKNSLRRIAGLSLKRDDASGPVTSEVNWAWGRLGE